MKKHGTDGEEIAANYMPEKAFAFRIYNSQNSINNLKTKNPIKWAKDLNRHFSEKRL